MTHSKLRLISDILLTKFLALPLTAPDEHLDLSDAFATAEPMELGVGDLGGDTLCALFQLQLLSIK